MDEPIEGGGSFDATGAFLGGDDKLGGSDRVRVSDTSHENVQVQSEKGDKQQSDTATANNETGDRADLMMNNVSESAHTTCQKDEYGKASVANDTSSEPVQKPELATATNIREKDEKSPEIEDRMNANDENVVKKKQITGNLQSYKNTSKFSVEQLQQQQQLHAQQHQPQHHHHPHQPPMLTASKKVSNAKAMDLTSIDRLQEVAEDIEKLIMDDDHSCNESDEVLLTSNLHRRDAHKHSSSADDGLVEPKAKDLTDNWFYRDPQGKIQGPFTATEMHEWYKAGYFDDTLNVRRVCDPQFIELGELVKACNGSIPFISMPPIIPPLLQSSANEISINASASAAAAAAPNVKRTTTPTKPLASHNLMHTGKLPPPTSANNPPYYDINNFLGLMNPPSDGGFRKWPHNDYKNVCARI